MTLQADACSSDLQPATVVEPAASPRWTKFAAEPAAGLLDRGRRHGRGKRQGRAARSPTVVPLMLFLMATVLMMQLQSFQKLFLVVAWRRSA